MEDGHILRGPYKFVTYTEKDKKTNKVTCNSTSYAIDVQHGDFIARYAEIDRVLPRDLDGKILRPGSTVLEGQVIATVGVQCGVTMLHFELYKDVARVDDDLSDRSPGTKYTNVPQATYERRDDLMDPTPYLDMWGALLVLQQANVLPKIKTHAEAYAKEVAEAKQEIQQAIQAIFGPF